MMQKALFADKEIKVLMNYYKIHGTVVFITKCF